MRPMRLMLAQRLHAALIFWVPLVATAVAIPLAFVRAWLAFVIYVLVAVMWLIPDRRIERNVVE